MTAGDTPSEEVLAPQEERKEIAEDFAEALLSRIRRAPGRAPKYDADLLWALVKPLYLQGQSVRDISKRLKKQGTDISRERVRILIAVRRKVRAPRT